MNTYHNQSACKKTCMCCTAPLMTKQVLLIRSVNAACVHCAYALHVCAACMCCKHVMHVCCEYALHVCAACTCCMYMLRVCAVCMRCMYVLHVHAACMQCVYVMNVYTPCMPCTYSLYVSAACMCCVYALLHVLCVWADVMCECGIVRARNVHAAHVLYVHRTAQTQHGCAASINNV